MNQVLQQIMHGALILSSFNILYGRSPRATLKPKPKKMLGDDYNLHQLRALGINTVKQTEGEGSGPTVLLGISLFFVIYHAVFL